MTDKSSPSKQHIAMDHNSAHVPTLISGHQAIISLLTASELATSPFLPLLFTLINGAFSHVIANGPKGLVSPTFRRLSNANELLEELGSNAFVYIISTPLESADKLKVFATASFKCFTGKVPESTNDFMRNFKNIASPDPATSIERWELVLMAVDPTLQNQGLAGKLMRLVEEDIGRRAKGSRRKIQIVLTTVKEHNESFYAKRGYIKTGENKIEKGVDVGPTGFTILEMMKML
ncbi:hypothetical protein MMC13_002624 [Lambiella insularis]|nr:hypothetical protein [Lambiella insularis]